MTIEEAQELNYGKYVVTTVARGPDKTFIRLTEELGEVARAMRDNNQENLVEELGDLLAWLMTLASIHNVNLEQAFRKKYGSASCFRCGQQICKCGEHSQPHPEGSFETMAEDLARKGKVL